jgi:hypothetical protein
MNTINENIDMINEVIDNSLNENIDNSVSFINTDNISIFCKKFSDEEGFLKCFRKDCWTGKMQQLFRIYKKTIHISQRKKIISNMITEFLNCTKNSSTLGEPTSLVLAAFRYYRYKWDSEEGKDGADLLVEAFSLSSIMQGEELKEEERIALLTAYCQSGKTFIIAAIIVIYLAAGETPVFIASDSEQVLQVRRRINSEFIEFVQIMNKRQNPFPQEELDIFTEILYYSSTEKCNLESLEKAISGEKPRLILCIKHHSHINRIANLITEDSKLTLIVDEAHSNGAYKKRSLNEEEIIGIEKYDQAYFNIKSYAKKVLLISATPIKIFTTERELYSDCVFFKTPGPDYRGLLWYEFKEIKNKKEVVLDVLQELSETTPIIRINKYSLQDTHPIIALFHHERIIQKQNDLLQAFHQDNPIISQTVLDANWMVATFQGVGMKVWHKSFMGNVIIINGITSTDLGSGEHLFNGVCPADLLNWTALNGGVQKFPRIAFIAYDMADEGISFSTHINPCWHLSDVIVIGSHTSYRINQICERLSGNNGDNIRPRVWLSKANKKQLLLEFKLTCDLRREICNMSRIGNVRVVDYIEQRTTFKNHIPPRFLSTLKNSKKAIFITTKKNPNEALENNLLNTTQFATDFLIGENEEYDKEAIKIENYVVERQTSLIKDEQKYIVIDTDVFAKNTKIYKILQDVIALIIDYKKINQDIEIDWINSKLQETKYSHMTLDSIRGNLWTNIRKNKHLHKTNIKLINSFLYWKDDNIVKVCLTKN